MSQPDIAAAVRPQPTEYAEYYGRYIDRVPAGNVLEQLEQQICQLEELAATIAPSVAQQVHPPYTWTITQVIGHMIDVEKVFGYRAHRFACGDLRPILGMEQNEFVANTDYQRVSLGTLIEEFIHVRRGNLKFFCRLAPEAWVRQGTADGLTISVRAIAFILAGHVTHHLDIIQSRVHR